MQSREIGRVTPLVSQITGLREARAEDALRSIPSWELEREPPEIEWLVEGCFPKANVAMVSGEGGFGKTTLMQQMLTAAPLSRDWLGMKCTPGNALLFSCEDDHIILHKRHRAILDHMEIEHADLEGGLHLVDRVGAKSNLLADFDRKGWRMEPTALFVSLGQFCYRNGITYVVIDTVTQTFGGNQNDARQVAEYLNILRRLAIAIQGAVIITMHPSRTGRSDGSGEGGSVAWNNGVRSRLYVRREGDSLVLSGMKSNYGEKLRSTRLRWQRGVFVADDIPDEAPRKLTRMELRYLLLQKMGPAIERGRKFYADEQHRDSLAQSARRSHDPAFRGISIAEFETAQLEMIRDGAVVMVDVDGRKLLRPAHGPAYKGEK